MFEFSTASIVVIAVCVIAIILLLFLYIYIGRREKQGTLSTEEKSAPADEQAGETEEAAREAEPVEAEVPQPVKEEAAVPLHSTDEELAASVEEALAEFDSVSAAEPERAAEAEKTTEPEATAEPEKVSGPEVVEEVAAERETAPEPVAEPEADAAAEPEKKEKLVKQDGPDLSALYQEVDEEDYEQVGTDVADAIALAFEQAVKPVGAEQAGGQSDGNTPYTAGQHLRGRIRSEETPGSQESDKNGEMPVGAHRTAAPGSVRKHRGSGR